MSQELVERYYSNQVQREWERMERHKTEFAVTRRVLTEWLPPAPAKLLDCGCGPGRYSVWLAGQGYQVTLFDLSGENLRFAEGKFAEAGLAQHRTVQGSAADLSAFAGEQFDAVLLMGPLYHLVEERDRHAAVSEAWRVLKPGGRLFASFITQHAPIRYALKNSPEYIIEQRDQLESFWQTGSFPPLRHDGSEFIGYFIPPRDIPPLIESGGFRLRALLGVEGLCSLIEEKLNAASDEIFDAWLELNYRAACQPELHALSEHLLAVAEK